ncbi:MAG TPA: carboxypeptidase-like regulatory domain-containing protein, partial [Holophagaceae bacterium]
MRRIAAALLLAPALLAQGLTSGSLRGTVQAADGTPLAGARLELEELRTGRRHAGSAGADGAFRFSGLAPGPWRLTVRAEGYGGQRLTGLRIASGSGTALSVELVPMESDLVMDTEVPAGPALGANPTRLGA